MKRTAREMESLIIAGLQEAVTIHKGEAKPVRSHMRTARETVVAPPPAFDAKRVVEIRQNVDVSQSVFANMLAVSPALVKGWEQGSHTPNGPAARLLQVVEERGADYLVGKLELRRSRKALDVGSAAPRQSALKKTIVHTKRVHATAKKKRQA